MNVSIFGIGYVGAVTAGCLTKQGHRIHCVDVNEVKVDGINAGQSPIFEPGLDGLLSTACDRGLLTATTDCESAVAASEVSIVCVGTPALESGRLNLAYVSHVYKQIADAVKSKGTEHQLILRSTMLPGSVRSLAEQHRPELITSGQLRVCFCPEFLREGSAIGDFGNPALAVYGTIDGERNLALEELMGDCTLMPLEAAELVKYACNYWHAVKVAFGNEVGRLSKHLSVDGHAVMEAFCQDTQLNISANYLRPGTPFGGSCLPKDIAALNSYARQEGVALPMLESIQASNHAHLDHLIQLVNHTGQRSVLIVGLSFKKGTDDLRGSPMVALAETLIGRGVEVEIYDTNIDLSRLTGSNQTETSRRLPHLAARLTVDTAGAFERNQLIVFAQDLIPEPDLAQLISADHVVLDVNGIPSLRSIPCHYEGLCWES
ncbi:nucleotide sugar dehydrogenase [Allorhodopirellula solitaria]|uniref:UDP-glucose 6-dehydrogenase n=1 Tax=Allorhodopirellula solitaria TaxID=2527987 RepID=A0A5C5YC31_9BACT|nr:nucleotide sugar dehydrogenase [Allorhodopirellula solitaria]TWT72940.1 GDP-mannose 6-dehydrogenase [Allorhodopirellula solitaria]